MNRLNKTESAVFCYCSFSLFLNDLGLFFVVVFSEYLLSFSLLQFNVRWLNPVVPGV